MPIVTPSNSPVQGDLHVAPPQVQELRLERKQLARLARDVAVSVTQALAETHAIGRSSYSIAEIAARAGFSEGYVRDAVRLGLLRVVRPGGRDTARVLPEDEALWLTGRLDSSEAAVVGLAERVVMRNRVKAIVGRVMRANRPK